MDIQSLADLIKDWRKAADVRSGIHDEYSRGMHDAYMSCANGLERGLTKLEADEIVADVQKQLRRELDMNVDHRVIRGILASIQQNEEALNFLARN